MEENMKDNIRMITSMEKESLHGQKIILYNYIILKGMMEGSIKGVGKMEKCTAEENTNQQME